MKKNGFYLMLRGKDVFIVTAQKAKTKAFLHKVAQKLELPDAPSVLDELRYLMRPATLEVKTIAGREMNEISGDSFGGYGHFVDEDKDLIIRVN